MADASVSLEASDLFSLAGHFVAQSATRAISQSHAKMKNVDGDYLLFSSTFNRIEDITVTYAFNSLTGLGGALPNLGSVHNAYLVTGVEVSSSTGEYPVITVTGHQHAENEHTTNNEYAIDATIAGRITGAVGAYDLADLASDPTCIQSSTYSISGNHIDAECGGDGDHWVGQTIEGMQSITCEYIGHISLNSTLSGWTVTSYSNDDSNEGFDVSSFSAEKLITRS